MQSHSTKTLEKHEHSAGPPHRNILQDHPTGTFCKTTPQEHSARPPTGTFCKTTPTSHKRRKINS
ncbi:hypothetical protein C2G38_2198617 [Gigaspora rosea]|uniref:Uncharacterized protein n=1 Tax=Gigaspora rosea TaxID=44941 RepID=A0A397UZW2_9GLOM|nr:hypothetical protein C2G38_2198617 [Gigaspora rosea]